MITLGIEAAALSATHSAAMFRQPAARMAGCSLARDKFLFCPEMCEVDAEMRDNMETAPRCWRMIHQSPDSGAARANDPAFCVVALVATIVKSDPYHD